MGALCPALSEERVDRLDAGNGRQRALCELFHHPVDEGTGRADSI